MGFAPIDEGFHSHPKVLALLEKDEDEGLAALGLWTLLLPLVRAQARPDHPERAGIVSRVLVRRYGGARGEYLAKLLVEARDPGGGPHGLWEVHDQGWRFHDFIENSCLGGQWQKSAQARRAITIRWDRELDTGEVTGVPTGEDTGVPTDEVQGRSRGRSRGREGPRTRGTRLPEDWLPSQELRSWAATECPGVDARRETAKFRDYWPAQPGQRGVKLDWDRTWRNWIRKAAEGAPPRRGDDGGSPEDLWNDD
jgi:hypothetical protein